MSTRAFFAEKNGLQSAISSNINERRERTELYFDPHQANKTLAHCHVPFKLQNNE